MFYRLMMIANGLAAGAGIGFWANALVGGTRAVSLEDQAVGYLLITVLRGY
jgi:hypothetical protein